MNFTDWKTSDALAHHGIPGMKWGVRRYQNPDGTLTAAGERRRQKDFYKTGKKEAKQAVKAFRKPGTSADERSIFSRTQNLLSSDSIDRISKLTREYSNSNKAKTDYYKKIHANGRKPTSKELKKLDHKRDKALKALDTRNDEIEKEARTIVGKYGKRRIKDSPITRGADLRYIVAVSLANATWEDVFGKT